MEPLITPLHASSFQDRHAGRLGCRAGTQYLRYLCRYSSFEVRTSATALVAVSRRWPGLRRPPRSAFSDGRMDARLGCKLRSPLKWMPTSLGSDQLPAARCLFSDVLPLRAPRLSGFYACSLLIAHNAVLRRQTHACPSYEGNGMVAFSRKHFPHGFLRKFELSVLGHDWTCSAPKPGCEDGNGGNYSGW